MKKIVLLGSTGSIGKSTLEVVSKFPRQFKIIGLSTHRNTMLLKKQIEQFKPKTVVITEEKSFNRFRKNNPDLRGKPLFGLEGLEELCTESEADLVVNALVGAVGLRPGLKALEAKKDLAIANKEALVMAGNLLTRTARDNGVQILPIDSEHSALKQCLLAGKREEVKRLILTASGGPFYDKDVQTLRRVTVGEALSHPTWNMGKKITIDSATLMNKGLEVIEAHWLFGISGDRIDVLVHPQSIVHSMVEYTDGSIIAQMSYPDMKLPIQYALFCSQRFPAKYKTLDLSKVKSLTFDKVDKDKFPCLGLAYLALKKGGTAPAVLNAANEMAVNAFLSKRIRFIDIASLIQSVLEVHRVVKDPTLAEIVDADLWAREQFSRKAGL